MLKNSILLDEMAADLAFAMEFAENEAQRELAEAELQQHIQAVDGMRLFLQTTLDAFPAHTAVLDPDGTIIDVNTAWSSFCEKKGGSPMHYLGRNYLTVCDMAAGSWSEEAAPAANGIRAVISGSLDEFYLEYPCHSPTEKRWFALRVTPFPETAPRRVVVAHIDITERQQAQNRLQNLYNELEKRVIVRTAELQTAKERVEAILNNSADAIVLVLQDFRIQQTSASFNRLFGCDQDEYFGQPLNVLLAPGGGSIMNQIFQSAADQRKLVLDVEARRWDGTVFAAELSIGSISDDSFICTFHDISQRKQVEQSLRAAVEKEKELNELKTRFVSMASHEFRTPLATIRAAIDTLTVYRARLTDDQIAHKLSNISEQIDFLTDIMDDLLELARLQTRRLEYQPETLDLDALWQEMLQEFQSHQNIAHQFRYTCASGLPTIQADKMLLRQIISNLLSNAVKYSPPDKVIAIKLKQTGDSVVFSVRDGGIGIPENDMPHLFEPFHRAANVGTIHGTGLGLVITKEAVDLHGGTISAESQLGIGTVFTVRIPSAPQGE